ncbi:MAG: DUF4870 domain-containing protein [Gammaproteobacteria bacterium]|nr:DUF4870 domain-containing protein [Gammaproteobacteria bacterium]
MSKTALGLDKNTTACLSYVLGWISGLIIILIEKDDDFVRFHAMQSIITFGSISIAFILFGSIMPFFIIISLLNLASIALWILLLIKSYQGQKFMLPVIGEISDQWAKKFGK